MYRNSNEKLLKTLEVLKREKLRKKKSLEQICFSSKKVSLWFSFHEQKPHTGDAGLEAEVVADSCVRVQLKPGKFSAAQTGEVSGLQEHNDWRVKTPLLFYSWFYYWVYNKLSQCKLRRWGSSFSSGQHDGDAGTVCALTSFVSRGTMPLSFCFYTGKFRMPGYWL